ncbi:uncharacterized protein C7orf78 homolog [Rhynchocyon petersi]
MDFKSQKARRCSRLQFPAQSSLSSKWKKNATKSSQSNLKANVWEIKPPDFSYKLYTTSGHPEKAFRHIKKGRRKTIINVPETVLHLPSIQNDLKSITPKFITTFARLDPHTAKIMFVKSGKYPCDEYINPKPYDFRQYQSNLPNFVTSYEKDPFGLKFKTKHLSTVHGCQLLEDNQQKKNGKEKFITYKPCECSWDAKLILPKDPWPNKSASYTRHRTWRDPYSAFMDRVEEKFNKTHEKRWAKKLSSDTAF